MFIWNEFFLEMIVNQDTFMRIPEVYHFSTVDYLKRFFRNTVIYETE